MDLATIVHSVGKMFHVEQSGITVSAELLPENAAADSESFKFATLPTAGAWGHVRRIPELPLELLAGINTGVSCDDAFSPGFRVAIVTQQLPSPPRYEMWLHDLNSSTAVSHTLLNQDEARGIVAELLAVKDSREIITRLPEFSSLGGDFSTKS